MIRVFLDANVYFSGCFSESGASRFILELARNEKILLYASGLVLRETARNLEKKASSSAVKTFQQYLRSIPLHLVPRPSEEDLKLWEGFLDSKDVPVLAAAVKSGADFLLTLDRRHFLTPALQTRVKKIKILTPGDFLRNHFV